MSKETPKGTWFKSSFSESSNACVEVRFDDSAVGVRDSKYPDGPELSFPPQSWDAFIDSEIWAH
ncbi:DUF397 domain-containing protein [Nocardia sp. NPDC050406]|uniref:DUF397 domain-containing protein n=1 Tax=Nocardia sp. NPDC050406 TaxID=3364318 RepID=UPI003797BC71